MSAKVDVLAVMDMAIDEADDVSRPDLERARAAIAELIAAARSLKVRPDGRGYFESGQDCQRFRAALAAATAQSAGSVTGEVQG